MAEENVFEVKVLEVGEEGVSSQVVIDAGDLDIKKHLHLSGRKFTAAEIKSLKGGKGPSYKK